MRRALATVSVVRATSETMRKRGEVRELREIVGSYVRHRLREECRERGTAAHIARETGFTTAHLTNVQKEGRGIGEEFARAMATYWNRSYAELEDEAQAWYAAQPPSVRTGQMRLNVNRIWREYPEWKEELAKAVAHYPADLHPWLAKAGEAIIPDRRPTPEGIGRVARLLRDTAGEAGGDPPSERAPGSSGIVHERPAEDAPDRLSDVPATKDSKTSGTRKRPTLPMPERPAKKAR